jgi:glycine/D-amino acid oxidase-like deaminating enzyme
VIHTAHGWWLREAGPVAPAPALAGDERADVVVVGGGYVGLWTAWQLLERGARVAVLEDALCGHGPSGRNGGFCETLWTLLPRLRERFGAERALAACRASSESVAAIGAWCEAQGVDAWFTRAGYMMVSTAAAHDAVIDRVLAVAPGDRVVALDGDAVRARCLSERFRRGLLVVDDATVQPARLALGLRARVVERGAAVFERSRVRALRVDGGGVVAETAGGRVRAGAAVLAVNAAARALPPLRSRLAVTSSHVVLTEPVGDVLEEIGWTGGECITDARTFVHYFRTTRDGRIAFGWGGGRPVVGARLNGRAEVDAAVVEETRRHLFETFPALAGRRITHAWGGPIDVSPSHLPQVGTLAGAPVHYAFGFTGNGVGPSHLAGRALAALAAGEQSPLALVDPAPPRVPPEPLAWLGGTAVRWAFLRKERLEEAGHPVDPLTRAVAAAPRALGIHVGR